MKVLALIAIILAIFAAIALVVVELVAMEEAGVIDSYYERRISRWKKRMDKGE